MVLQRPCPLSQVGCLLAFEPGGPTNSHDSITIKPFGKALKGKSIVGRRYTKIVIETEEVVVARIREKPIVAWCPTCQAKTQKVTALHAALLCHVEQRSIQVWIQGGQLHISEAPEGGLLICLKSLEAVHSHR